MTSDYSSELEIMDSPDGSSHHRPSKRPMLLGGLVVLAAGILVGFMIGWLSKPADDPTPGPPEEERGPCLGVGVPNKIIQDGEGWVQDRVLQDIQPDNIRDNLE